MSVMIPPAARFGARMYEREWREDLLPRYVAAVDRAEERVDKADASELMALIDELAGLAGHYFASMAVVAGYAYKAEGMLVISGVLWRTPRSSHGSTGSLQSSAAETPRCD